MVSNPTALDFTTDDAEEVQCPPSNLWSDEPPLESDFHRDQIDLLIQILRDYWRDRPDVYISGNLTIYYNQQQLKSRDFRGPDFFVVLGTEKRDRRSWVVWDEQGRYPNVILEILSKSTADVDKGIKKDLYQTTFRTPDYFWFDPETEEFQGFHLMDGAYVPISPTDQGWLWSQQLQLFLGIHDHQLRFFTAEGSLIPSPAEKARQEQARADAEQQRADAERQRADAERQRADAERQRAEQAEAALDQLRSRLRAQGLELDED